MRVVVVGATGNVGTSVLHALARRGPGRRRSSGSRGAGRRSSGRRPSGSRPTSRSDDLEPHFRGADCVVHLAWLIQPSRDEATLLRDQRRRLAARLQRDRRRRACRRSSTRRRSAPTRPGPKDRAVDESWPTDGIATSFYSRHKAATERLLDSLEREHPDLRVVRLRPGPDLQARGRRPRSAGYFAGPFLPNPLVRTGLIPIVPEDRAACASRPCTRSTSATPTGCAIVRDDARGAYNVAADPVLDPDELGRLLGARQVPVPAGACCASAADLTWKLRLQPTPKGWVDMGLGVPIMDTARIRTELGWKPTHDRPARRCSTCSPACATAAGRTRRRWRPDERTRCACASSLTGVGRQNQQNETGPHDGGPVTTSLLLQRLQLDALAEPGAVHLVVVALADLAAGDRGEQRAEQDRARAR